MRERYQIELVSGSLYSKRSTDNCLEAFTVDELADCETPHCYDQTRPKDFNLFIQPRRAVRNFFRRGHAIATTGIFARKTTADCREIYLGANVEFGEMTILLE